MHNDDLSGRLGELMRYGSIATVDLAAGRITVRIGEIVTQPIRFFSGGAGGTRVWSRPKVGEQVQVFAPDGDIAGAIAMRGVHSDAFPPVGDPDRELVQFEDGAVIAYNPTSHALELILPAGATVRLVAPAGVAIDADVAITGDVSIDGKLTTTGDITTAADVKAGSISLKTHKTLGVQPGTGTSQGPQ